MTSKADIILRKLSQLEQRLNAIEFATGADTLDFAGERVGRSSAKARRAQAMGTKGDYLPPARSTRSASALTNVPKETPKGGGLGRRGKIALGLAGAAALGGAGYAAYKANQGGVKKGRGRDKQKRRRRTR